MIDLPTETSSCRPVVLCILDGWGDRAECADNAIALAQTPNWDRFVAQCPRSRLHASALQVGLPEGQMGNSEVGHMNLGAGRVVLQDLPRIDQVVANGTLKDIPELRDFIHRMRGSGGTCHLMGLMSPGGVHSHQGHIAELARIIAKAGVPVAVHAFLDGRDTPPRAAVGYMGEFLTATKGIGDCRVATICGRYYVMDRDERWDRVGKAYSLLVDGMGAMADDPITAIEASYADDKGDEFVLPVALNGYAGMVDGDGLLLANFRADRAREILSALVDPGFEGFRRSRRIDFAACLGMVAYSEYLSRFLPAMFPPEDLTATLGEVVARAGLLQLRIAETEKYAHVTFFLNGGREREFAGEERILVPSPKVATYDLQPEMSAPEMTDKLVAAIETGRFDLIVVNYANGDMVGHTGILDAAKRAAEAVDGCLERLANAVTDAGGTLLITADHGNAEQMRDPVSGEPHTAHTMNLVPFILVNGPADMILRDGSLSDVAPTVLMLMGLLQPPEMTGLSLLAGGGACN
jgi:2,3-bisphosphoglycerate-independent phosphoglycerate mutase